MVSLAPTACLDFVICAHQQFLPLALLQAMKIVDLYGKNNIDVSKQLYIKVCRLPARIAMTILDVLNGQIAWVSLTLLTSHFWCRLRRPGKASGLVSTFRNRVSAAT